MKSDAVFYYRYTKILYSIASLILISGIIVSLYTEYPVYSLFEDPAKNRNFYGLFTYLGCILWASSAAICLFCSLLLSHSNNRALSRFVAAGGLLSLVLLFDDLFLFHEFIESRNKTIGENGVFLAYTIAITTYLIWFRRSIISTNFKLLGIAFLFFSLSLFIDVFAGPWLWRLGTWFIVVEDTLKFFGIVGWFGYFVNTCYLSCKHARSATT